MTITEQIMASARQQDHEFDRAKAARGAAWAELISETCKDGPGKDPGEADAQDDGWIVEAILANAARRAGR